MYGQINEFRLWMWGQIVQSEEAEQLKFTEAY